jgi:hypothetical protein
MAAFTPPFTDRDNSREDPIVPRVLTDEQAKTLAQRHYTAAGLPETIQIFRIQEFAGDRKMSIVMDYVPLHQGVPYDRFVAGSRIEVNQETGNLHFLGTLRGPMPKPPADMKPRITLEEAKATVLAAVQNEWGGGPLRLGEGLPAHLCIWRAPISPFPDRLQWLTPEELAASARKEGMLAYVVQYEDTAQYIEKFRQYVVYNGYVDAKTGRLLVLDLYPRL